MKIVFGKKKRQNDRLIQSNHFIKYGYFGLKRPFNVQLLSNIYIIIEQLSNTYRVSLII